jgi:hypothetical protein
VIASEVADSILMSGCEVSHLPGRLERSILGPNARVGGGDDRPRIISCMLGEKSHVAIF